MQCPNCGAFTTKEDVFCGECGQPMVLEAAPAEQVSPLEVKDQATDALDLSPVAPPPAAQQLERKRQSPAPILLVVGAAMLMLCLLGIGILIWLGSTDKPSKNEAVPAAIIYQEDFGDPASGWDVYTEDDTWAGYVDGEYRLGIYRDNYVAWGNPDHEEEFADFVVEVTARQVEGPLDNNFGLLVRYQPDDDNFYWFQISSDGYYSVDLMRADQWITLVSWEESEAIKQGVGATNQLKVICSGSEFSFYVNDIYLTSMADSAFSSGNIGLAVGTFDEPGVLVHFDDVVVYAIQE